MQQANTELCTAKEQVTMTLRENEEVVKVEVAVENEV